MVAAVVVIDPGADYAVDVWNGQILPQAAIILHDNCPYMSRYHAHISLTLFNSELRIKQ